MPGPWRMGQLSGVIDSVAGFGDMMPAPMPDRASLSSRRDLTFKHNAALGRHGWLRLTPAYSVRIVSEVLDREPPQVGVLDPYSGTGTTALCASERGIPAQATDINPFLVWLGKQKTARFSPAACAEARALVVDASRRVVSGIEPAPAPPLYNIERWWSRPVLDTLCLLKAAIPAATNGSSRARSLLEIAFCRTMISESAATFDHQSMSFSKAAPAAEEPERTARSRVLQRFAEDARVVIDAAEQSPQGRARVHLGDARSLKPIAAGSFDLVLTSPPYPNRMSYIRELRPYMYWMGYLSEASQAAELDWRAIGGTWGGATSRLQSWQPPAGESGTVRALSACLQAIRRADGRSTELLARYVHRYFLDMREHLGAVAARLAPGGRVHYIVGNSCFYGQLVPTERIFAAFLREQGFVQVAVKTLRKRNSKRELFEFDVAGTKP